MINSEELLLRIYNEIKTIKEEINEIKSILLPEEDVSEDEVVEIEKGISEIKKGQYRAWEDVKKELN